MKQPSIYLITAGTFASLLLNAKPNIVFIIADDMGYRDLSRIPGSR